MSKLTIGDVILYLVPHNLAARKVVENNPRRWSKPPGDSTTSIVLTFNDQPKEVRSGFLLGYGKEADIHLVSSTESKAYITFNCTSGLAILINSKAVEGASFKLIVDGLAFRCDGAQFGIRVPQRGRYQAHYADRLSKYLALMTPNPTNPVKGIYADPITPKAEVGCYWEIKKVGNGAFGEVCLFAHRPTGQMFAGKRFNNPRDIQAILTEIKTLRSARHENIVQYVDNIKEPNGSICLMMEYLPFGNLASRKKFKLPGAIEILRQCLQGLQYLHSRNIVHRDIKPDNIVLKSEFPIQVKLVDFGLATECTYNVQAAGTIVYLAPEVLAGSPYTCSVDIWALGLTALGLRNAFPLQEAINYNANRTPQQLSWYLTAIQRAIQTQVPPVAKLLLGMLAHQPQQRWNATYCLQQIEAVKHFLVSPAQAPPVTWGVPGQPGANGWQFQGQQNVILVPSQGASWGQRGLVRANSTSGRRKISLSNPGRINWNDPAPFM